MFAVEAVGRTWPSRWMTAKREHTTPNRVDGRRVGDALRLLRERASLTQEEAAARIGATQQTWQRYETGRSGAVLKVDQLERAAQAVGVSSDMLLTMASSTSDELMIVMPGPAVDGAREEMPVWGSGAVGAPRPSPDDLAEPVRTVRGDDMFGPGLRALEMSGESMVPWAEPGDVIVYDTRRQPRRGRGCVVEMKTGERHVRLYSRSDGGTLFVEELFPEPRVVNYRLVEVKGVYPVRWRGE